MSARPGRIAAVYDIDIPRPRSVEIQTQPEFIERVMEIKRASTISAAPQADHLDDRLGRTSRGQR